MPKMTKAHIARWSETRNDAFEDSNPNDRQYKHRILAEGDSWFSLGGFPTSNIFFPMKFEKSTIIVSCALPGDTIVNMADIQKNNDFKKAMSRNRGFRWHAILLSGGGNDLINNAKKIIVGGGGNSSDPADYCKDSKLQKTLDGVEDGYRKIVAQRDKSGSSCKGKPIITHTYDFVTPRKSPARFFGLGVFGPWFFRALKKAKVPRKRWNDIADYLQAALADRLLSLANGQNKLPNFHVVNTLNTIVPAELGTTRESNDWMNEIHPSFDGYKKLATKISRKVRQLLP